jgi:hypothetical protein
MNQLQELTKKLKNIADVPSLCSIYLQCKTNKEKEKFWNDVCEISLYKEIIKSLLQIKQQPFDQSFHTNRAKPLLRFKNKPNNCSIIMLSECVVFIHQENLSVIHFSCKKLKDSHYFIEDLKYTTEWNCCWNAYDTLCLTGYDLDFKLKHKHINTKSNDQRVLNMEYCEKDLNSSCSSSSNHKHTNNNNKCFSRNLPEFILMKKVCDKNNDHQYHEIYYQTKWPFCKDFLEYLAWPTEEKQVRMIDLNLILQKPSILINQQSKRKQTTNLLQPQKRQK